MACSMTRASGSVGIERQRLPHVLVHLRPRVGRTVEAVDHHHRVVARKRGVGQRKFRVADHRKLEQPARVEVVLLGGESLTVAGLQIQIVCVTVGRRVADELFTLVIRQSHAQAIVHDRAGDLVLDVEQVRGVAIVAVRLHSCRPLATSTS